jgi:hypothetical protein
MKFLEDKVLTSTLTEEDVNLAFTTIVQSLSTSLKPKIKIKINKN